MITLEMQTKFSAGRQTHSCRILFGTNADRANMEQAVGMQPAVGWNLQTRDRAALMNIAADAGMSKSALSKESIRMVELPSPDRLICDSNEMPKLNAARDPAKCELSKSDIPNKLLDTSATSTDESSVGNQRCLL